MAGKQRGRCETYWARADDHNAICTLNHDLLSGHRRSAVWCGIYPYYAAEEN